MRSRLQYRKRRRAHSVLTSFPLEARIAHYKYTHSYPPSHILSQSDGRSSGAEEDEEEEEEEEEGAPEAPLRDADTNPDLFGSGASEAGSESQGSDDDEEEEDEDDASGTDRVGKLLKLLAKSTASASKHKKMLKSIRANNLKSREDVAKTKSDSLTVHCLNEYHRVWSSLRCTELVTYHTCTAQRRAQGAVPRAPQRAVRPTILRLAVHEEGPVMDAPPVSGSLRRASLPQVRR